MQVRLNFNPPQAGLCSPAGRSGSNAVFIALLPTVILSTSCRKAVEKAQRNIRFEGSRRSTHRLTGAEMVVRVMNDTGYAVAAQHGRDDTHIRKPWDDQRCANRSRCPAAMISGQFPDAGG